MLHALRLREAGDGDLAFLKAKIATEAFFAQDILPQAAALPGPVTNGATLLFDVPEEQFCR